MTVAGMLELLAWLLSAVIACWLLADMVGVSRRYGERLLMNPGEHMPDPSADAEGASRHEHG